MLGFVVVLGIVFLVFPPPLFPISGGIMLGPIPVPWSVVISFTMLVAAVVVKWREKDER